MDEIAQFLERLSSGNPIPGGGSVAALEAAMAASLLVMVANLTIGREKFAQVQDQIDVIRLEAERLRDRATRLAQEDEEAYGAVSEALKLPRATDAEKAARRAALQTALKGAAEPPLETMRVASSIAQLARREVEVGNSSAISDLGVSALSARSAYHAARLNVEANMAAVKDADWLQRTAQLLRTVADPEELVRQTVERAEAVIRGESG